MAENTTVAAAEAFRRILEVLEQEEEEKNMLEEAEEDEDLTLLGAVELEERTSGRRWYVRPLNRSRAVDGLYVTLIEKMRSMDEEKHFALMRMSVSRFDDLLRRVQPFIEHASNHSLPITPAQRLAVTLCILASGASPQFVSAAFKMGKSTVCAIVGEVCKAIWLALKDDFVAFPSQAQFREIAMDFWRLWNYPNCIGAIDGKHCNLQAPPNSGSEYFNYKGHHSIVLMAVCDARHRFTILDVGAFGRESDGWVFAECSFGKALQNGELDLPAPQPLPGTTIPTMPHVFIGDAAFPQSANLMSPYGARGLTEKQQIYNYRHSRARMMIEDTFGILRARWRILGQTIEASPEKAGDIVHACVALHNYLIYTDASRYIPANYSDSTTASGDLQPGAWRRDVEGDTNLQSSVTLSRTRASQAARDTRDDFAEFFLTPQGRVAWQETVVRRGLLHPTPPINT